MAKKTKTIWKAAPAPHDFEAAEDYLLLLFGKKEAAGLLARLRAAPLTTRLAKDLLRASRVPLLPETNSHVADDLHRIKKGKQLSPVLLVRGDGAQDVALTIADGYHRICASWYWNENEPVACSLVSLPGQD